MRWDPGPLPRRSTLSLGAPTLEQALETDGGLLLLLENSVDRPQDATLNGTGQRFAIFGVVQLAGGERTARASLGEFLLVGP